MAINPLVLLAAAKTLQGLSERRGRERDRKRELADIEAERSIQREKDAIEENRRQAEIFQKREEEQTRRAEDRRRFDVEQQLKEAEMVFQRGARPSILRDPTTNEHIGYVEPGGDVQFLPTGREPKRNFLEEKLADQYLSGERPITDAQSLAVANPILRRHIGAQAELTPRPGVAGGIGRFVGGLQRGMGLEQTYGLPQTRLVPVGTSGAINPPPQAGASSGIAPITPESVGRAVDQGILTPELGDSILQAMGFKRR
jgi:hypothetical protein